MAASAYHLRVVQPMIMFQKWIIRLLMLWF